MARKTDERGMVVTGGKDRFHSIGRKSVDI